MLIWKPRTDKKKYARALRQRMTEAEALLWSVLRRRSFNNAKFRRQVAVGPFVVDFLCREYHLIIEVDGGIHAEQREYDTLREHRLQEFGYFIIRFKNEEVLNSLPIVLRKIQQTMKQTKYMHPPLRLPRRK